MVDARRDIEARTSAATEAAALAAKRAEQITRDNAALLADAVRSLEHSATLAEELAQRAERFGRTQAAATARAHATRARHAASTRLALSD